MNNVTLDILYMYRCVQLHIITNVFAVKLDVVYLIWCFWGNFYFQLT